METKRCRQCGEVKPTDKFRPYYNSEGIYTICKACEKINSRAKYLMRKGDKATEADKAELAKIEQLYEYQRIAGLKPPRRRNDLQKSLEAFDALISKYKQVASVGPQELQQWLTEELTEEPEHYIDVVYEQLISKYRPVIRIDAATLTPVYDETYKDLLNQILERFSAYEDNYYN